MKWMGHVAHMGEGRNVFRVLVGKTEGKRPLGRRRHRLENGIKMILRKLAGRVWSGFSWLRIEVGSRLL
jgi:hypothetical protein